ncbi:hypothetical protein AMTR_s00010p00047800 [Amborella trichopoda]|uniref:Uncharacterized protein n=1 Tax=Amborella trichopoda TaxID=13333 RepID=W1NE39_AMBTC|nr:hypothetical protein AMTR_s00010p00047800 [Amborella trichopoda]
MNHCLSSKSHLKEDMPADTHEVLNTSSGNIRGRGHERKLVMDFCLSFFNRRFSFSKIGRASSAIHGQHEALTAAMSQLNVHAFDNDSWILDSRTASHSK